MFMYRTSLMITKHLVKMGKWVLFFTFTGAGVEMPSKGLVHNHRVGESQSPGVGSSFPISSSKGLSWSISSPSTEWFPGHHRHPTFSCTHIHSPGLCHLSASKFPNVYISIIS